MKTSYKNIALAVLRQNALVWVSTWFTMAVCQMMHINLFSAQVDPFKGIVLSVGLGTLSYFILTMLAITIHLAGIKISNNNLRYIVTGTLAGFCALVLTQKFDSSLFNPHVVDYKLFVFALVNTIFIWTQWWYHSKK